MTTTVTVDRMRWWHIAEVEPIEADLFGPEKWSAASFFNELARGCAYLVATDGEQIIGYVGVDVAPPDEAWINNIAVRRDRQHHGIGRLLLDRALAIGRDRGARQTLLEVASDNGPAQRLYDRYGFEVIGVRRGYYQSTKTDALVMRRIQR